MFYPEFYIIVGERSLTVAALIFSAIAIAERALRNLGFIEDKNKSTSHRQWRKIIDGHLYKVTLDCHKGEVSANNIRSMVKQAGVSVNMFYEAADK